ncbi:UNVERIFIED_CONTAM: hypothetical protein FKN15_009537 [Acipenser sinensis]
MDPRLPAKDSYKCRQTKEVPMHIQTNKERKQHNKEGGPEEWMELGIEILFEKRRGVMQTADLEVDAIAAFGQREVEWPVEPQTPHALAMRLLKILLNRSRSGCAQSMMWLSVAKIAAAFAENDL